MKIRSFIAINLPTNLKKEISFLIEELKEKNNSREIKWVNSENVHLTLHFLGSLDEERIEQVKKIIQKNIVNLKPLEITLKYLGGFPNLEQPRVLFISGDETNQNQVLKKLQKKLGQDLEKIGLDIDHRPWQIHFTLARFKTPTKINTSCCTLDKKFFSVKSIDLMKSNLTPSGAKYIILESYQI